jgi:hypothetical protein
MANYNFKQDIVEGEEGEKIVLMDLESLGAILISDNKDNKYDMVVSRNGRHITYEIKTDVFCTKERDTGNMFLEIECRGKKSGVMVTTADWFVTYYKHLNEIWYIKTKNLLDLINKEQLHLVANSGDTGSNTKGYLLPRAKYQKNFIIRKYNG